MFASQVQHLASQPDQLVDVACLSGDTNRQLWKEVCEFSQLGALNSTDLAYLLLEQQGAENVN